jgi:hypothetical protein
MAIDLVTALREVELKPADFMDITQMVIDTMKPSAVSRLSELAAAE